MPRFRFIVEETGLQSSDGSIGFFTTRSGVGATVTIAQSQMLQRLAAEWRDGESKHLSSRPPDLTIVDCWRVRLLNKLRRIPDRGHSLYTSKGRLDAARLEAKVARAASDCMIWSMATDR